MFQETFYLQVFCCLLELLYRRIQFPTTFSHFLLALDPLGYRCSGKCSLAFHYLALDHLASRPIELLLSRGNFLHNICSLKVLLGNKHLDQESLLRLSSQFSLVLCTINDDNVYLTRFHCKPRFQLKELHNYWLLFYRFADFIGWPNLDRDIQIVD